jgi:hypothetical protein
MTTSFSPTRLQVVSNSVSTLDAQTTSADAIWIKYTKTDGTWVLSSGVILKTGKKVSELGLDLTPGTVGGTTIKLVLIGGTSVRITGSSGNTVAISRGDMVTLTASAPVNGVSVFSQVIHFTSDFSRFDVMRPGDGLEKSGFTTEAGGDSAPFACTEQNCPPAGGTQEHTLE